MHRQKRADGIWIEQQACDDEQLVSRRDTEVRVIVDPPDELAATIIKLGTTFPAD